MKERHVDWPPSLLVELLTNSCLPFTLPLALQTRQFTKRQLRSQEVNAIGVLSKASMPKPNLKQSAWNTACCRLTLLFKSEPVATKRPIYRRSSPANRILSVRATGNSAAFKQRGILARLCLTFYFLLVQLIEISSMYLVVD